MSFFIGEIEATFDEKGRVVLPADYKSQMGGSVPRGQLAVQVDKHVKCLNVYTIDEWERQVSKIRSKLNLNNPDHARMLDSFLRRSRVITVPENCRFTIPAQFLNAVGIVKQVMFTGQCERMRLWDIKEYQEYVDSLGDVDKLFDEKFGGEEAD